jgi:hypothetical protein
MSTPQSVSIQAMPTTIDEFVALRNTLAGTPQGGAAMMVVALYAYVQDEALGHQCLAVAVDHSRLEEGSNGYKGWQLRTPERRRVHQQIAGRAYIVHSYIQGTSPASGYQLPSPPYVLEFSTNPYSGDLESGTYKVFVASSGADSPRPVTLKHDARGIWKAYEWSSLLVGVAAPAGQDAPDL